jgi:hypothetical protein
MDFHGRNCLTYKGRRLWGLLYAERSRRATAKAVGSGGWFGKFIPIEIQAAQFLRQERERSIPY